MEIDIKICSAPIEPTKYKMISISKHKYSDVDLCLKLGNKDTSPNIHFASIDMNDGTYGDKKSQFESLSDFGKKIAEAWNEKYGHGNDK